MTNTPVDDAGSSPTGEAATNPCSDGQIFCDGDCIAAIEPTGSAMIDRVFKVSCGLSASCHTGVSPQRMLALDNVDHLFATAVGQTSTESPALKLIDPGNPDTSYLIDKMLGKNLGPDVDTGMTSTVMPQPPSDPLCDAKIAAVRSWIQAGAQR